MVGAPKEERTCTFIYLVSVTRPTSLRVSFGVEEKKEEKETRALASAVATAVTRRSNAPQIISDSTRGRGIYNVAYMQSRAVNFADTRSLREYRYPGARRRAVNDINARDPIVTAMGFVRHRVAVLPVLERAS